MPLTNRTRKKKQSIRQTSKMKRYECIVTVTKLNPLIENEQTIIKNVPQMPYMPSPDEEVIPGMLIRRPPMMLVPYVPTLEESEYYQRKYGYYYKNLLRHG